MDPPPNARLDDAPREAVIRFSERVEPRPSTLEVLDARGQRVDRGDARVDPADPWRYRVTLAPLTPGAFTVAWRVLSADDGHVTHGAHVFTVGVAGAAGGQSGPTVQSGVGWRPLARWMVALGGALLLGALVGGPLLGVGAAGGSRGMAVLGGAAVAVGGTLDLVLQAGQLAGPRPLGETLVALLTLPPGRVWLVRAGLLLGLVVVGRVGEAGRWLRIGLAAAVVMTGGFVSHGAAVSESRWLILGLEALHLLAMASWVGGLIGFGTVFWRAGPKRAPTHEMARLALAIPTFSGMAVVAVGCLAVSGFLLGRLHLAGWGDLLGTTYGRWLAAKLGVFLVMLTLGAWHQTRIEPALVRAIRRSETTTGWVSRFRRSIRVEAAVGLVALALAGTLGVTAPPAPSTSGGPAPSAGFRHERAFEEARVRVEIAPLRPGPNAIRLVVTDPAGRPLADATAAMIQVTPVDASVGAVTFQLDRAGPGEFVAPAAVLGLVGRWDGRLVVQRSGAYDVNDRFEMVVSEEPSAHAHGSSAAPARRSLPLDRVSGGAALAMAVITLALYVRSRRRLRTVQRLLADTPQPPAVVPAPR
jgi:copper transport protein